VETRAILLGGGYARFGGDEGCVVVDPDGTLAAVIGAPAPRDVAAAAEALRGELLVDEAHAGRVAAALPAWRSEGAVIHTWTQAAPAPSQRAATRLLAPGESLGHLPPDLRQEVEDARSWTRVVAACAGGIPVAFCYAGSETETLWDVSIDTLEPYRGRGLARAAFLHLAEILDAAGKSPVWGALDSNVASLRMAAALGFVPVDRLVVFSRMDPPIASPPA
jgi:GNAT superfamily N-acetyltransferase